MTDLALKALLAIFVVLLGYLAVDLIAVDDHALRTGQLQESMAKDCAKPEGMLVGLKSLFMCSREDDEGR